MAGGVWYLREWEHWIGNPELGPIAFQFGTRPLLTQESPISDAWKRRLLTLKEGDVFLNRFSPTGFYSSAVSNPFIQELRERSERQVAYSMAAVGEHEWAFPVGARGRTVYPDRGRQAARRRLGGRGLSPRRMRTPDSTLIFVTPEKAQEIHTDQINCMGCLSACLFSNWAQNDAGTTGKKADPRSYCIQKTLQTISHSAETEQQSDVRRPQRLSLQGRPLLRQRLRADRPAAGRAARHGDPCSATSEHDDEGRRVSAPTGETGDRVECGGSAPFFARCPNSSTKAL